MKINVNWKTVVPGATLKRRLSDMAGVSVAALCLVHCVILPSLLTPLLIGSAWTGSELEWLRTEWVHEAMFIMTLMFGVISIYLASRKGKVMPVVCLSVGLIAVAAAEFFLHDLLVVRLPGSLCMIGGHLWAMRGTGFYCGGDACRVF